MPLNRVLKDIADRQWGYFTARQASENGYPRNMQCYHSQKGHWLKVDRALFRLPCYADCLEAELIRWLLWTAGQSRRRLVAVSHHSALYYYGLSDKKPDVVDLTVSAVKQGIDNNSCRMHLGTLADTDRHHIGRLCLTSPAKTLRDMRPDLLYLGRWGQTVWLALNKGLINSDSASELLGDALYNEMLNTERSWANHEYTGSAAATVQEFARVGAIELGDIQRSSGMSNLFKRMHMQRNERTERQVPNRSFTFVELLIVVAIIMILAMLLFPMLNDAVRAAQTMGCTNNQKNLLAANHTYASDNYGFLIDAISLSTISNGIHDPERYWWHRMELQTYAPKALFVCPSDAKPDDWATHFEYGGAGEQFPISYAYSGVLGNGYLWFTRTDYVHSFVSSKRISDFKGNCGARSIPNKAFVLIDGLTSNKVCGNNSVGIWGMSARHNGGIDIIDSAIYPEYGKGNFAFVDGHVEAISAPFSTSFFSKYDFAGWF